MQIDISAQAAAKSRTSSRPFMSELTFVLHHEIPNDIETFASGYERQHAGLNKKAASDTEENL